MSKYFLEQLDNLYELNKKRNALSEELGKQESKFYESLSYEEMMEVLQNNGNKISNISVNCYTNYDEYEIIITLKRKI